MFAALVAHKKVFGDCNVPKEWPENPKLGAWANTQRQDWKKGRLNKERTRRLEQLGFVWDLKNAKWEKMFSALVEYRDSHGDCNVPARWPENPQLGLWASNIRRRKESLSDEKVRRLDELGFVWNASEAYWKDMFDALVEYREHHGNCLVPYRWPESPQLSVWVANLRARKENLSEEKICRLDELGFVWSVKEANWVEMFAFLVEYREAHGNCQVPARWQGNRKLATWVDVQRQARRKGTLREDRIKRLDEIGFVWDPLSAE
jgi:hypothetical protein